VDLFIITSLTKDISRIDLIGILIGHLIFGVDAAIVTVFLGIIFLIISIFL